MKKKILGLITACAIIFTLVLSGCSDGKKLNDFDEYKNLDLKSVSRLEVGLQTPWKYFEFTINHARTINEVTNTYKKQVFECIGTEGCDDVDGYGGYIIMYTESGEEFNICLSSIKSGEEYYGYKSMGLHYNLHHYALENRSDRVYWSIQQSAKGKVDLDKLQSIEVGWQTTEEYVQGSITYFNITEKEAIDYIVNKLSDKKAIIWENNSPEQKDYSHIRFFDGTYFEACIVNISENGNPRCSSDEVRNYVRNYGIEKGYLNN